MNSFVFMKQPFYGKIPHRWINIAIVCLALSSSGPFGEILGVKADHTLDSESRNSANNIKFDHTKIVQIPSPLYIDIAVLVTAPALNILRNYKANRDDFFGDVFSLISRIYSQHNIFVSVKRLNYWEREDANILKNPLDYSGYKRYFAQTSPPMAAYVIITEFPSRDELGWGSVNTICTPDGFTIVKMGMFLNNSKVLARCIAHELGHIMGFQHSDRYSLCLCADEDRRNCLMYSLLHEWDVNYPLSFEDCNMRKVIHDQYKYTCLLRAIPEHRYFGRCGDGVADENEDCDCGGLPYLCNNLTKKGHCCNMKTCRYKKSDYKCDSGECCHDCKFKIGSVCRKAVGECDIPEYCDGSSPGCPDDAMIDNFELCKNGRGICYNGICTNFNSLCKYIYDDDEIYFSQECVNEALRTMQVYCPDSPEGPRYKLLCEKYPNICNHFMCAKEGGMARNTVSIPIHTVACLIPDEIIRKGPLVSAANYMKCAKDNRHFCFNGRCTNDTNLLRNCKGSSCTNIENSKTIRINKLVYMPPSWNRYKLVMNDKTRPKTKSSSALINKVLLAVFTLIGIVIFCLLFWIVSFIKKRRNCKNRSLLQN